MKENRDCLPGQGSRLRKWTAQAGTVRFCAVLYGFLVLFDLCLVSRGDDLYLETGIEECGSLFGWMRFWAESWSGRILPQGILVWLMQFPPIVFHLVNAGVWLLLLWGTLRCLDRDAVLERGWGMVLVLGGIFLLIPSSVLDDSVYWKCANVSYLWGTAAMMTAICPLVLRLEGRACSAAGRAAAVIACIYAAGFEQSGALMSGLMVCFLIGLCMKERRCDGYALWMTVLSCAVTAAFFLLPGNAVRAGAETIVWFPNYDMYSLPEQLLLGIQYAISRSMQEVPELLLFIALLNLWYVMSSGGGAAAGNRVRNGCILGLQLLQYAQRQDAGGRYVSVRALFSGGCEYREFRTVEDGSLRRAPGGMHARSPWNEHGAAGRSVRPAELGTVLRRSGLHGHHGLFADDLCECRAAEIHRIFLSALLPVHVHHPQPAAAGKRTGQRSEWTEHCGERPEQCSGRMQHGRQRQGRAADQRCAAAEQRNAD